jgi:hypothetical protein
LFILTIFSKSFNQLKISVTKPPLFAPEQFEDCFIDMVSNSLNKTDIITSIKKWVTGDKSIKKLDNWLLLLIILIDAVMM